MYMHAFILISDKNGSFMLYWKVQNLEFEDYTFGAWLQT